MTAQVQQGLLVAATTSVSNPQVQQGVIVAAVSFLPPNSPPQIDQGLIVAMVRQFPVIRNVIISPAVNLPCIATCGAVPHFWRET